MLALIINTLEYCQIIIMIHYIVLQLHTMEQLQRQYSANSCALLVTKYFVRSRGSTLG